MKYYVYIIESLVDSSFYIGYTSDLERRINEHNEGKSKFTSKKRPWKIVYTEEFCYKSDAIKREKFLKKQKNRYFYNRIIESQKRPGSSVG